MKSCSHPQDYLFILLLLQGLHAQGTVPTFQFTAGNASYTLAGRDPKLGGTTVIPTVLIPLTIAFESKGS